MGRYRLFTVAALTGILSLACVKGPPTSEPLQIASSEEGVALLVAAIDNVPLPESLWAGRKRVAVSSLSKAGPQEAGMHYLFSDRFTQRILETDGIPVERDAQGLHALGVEISPAKADLATADLILVWRVQEAGLSWVEIKDEGDTGDDTGSVSGSLLRTAHIQVHMRLIEALTGRVLWVGNADESASVTVEGEAPAATRSDFTFYRHGYPVDSLEFSQ